MGGVYQTMLGLALEIRGQCAGCGQPLPINACVEHLVCSMCQRSNSIDAARWTSLLEDEMSAVDELEPNEGRHRTMMIAGGGAFHQMVGNQKPRCGRCKTAVPEEAATDAFLDRGWIGCVGCGEKISLRRAPDVVAALGAVALVGEDLALVGGPAVGANAQGQAQGQAQAQAQVPATAKAPVVLYCPSCNGPLGVDGSSRMVNCQYCSTGVYLPDDVWHRLHPVATMSRWYLWLPEHDKAARALSRFTWSSIEDMAIGADPSGGASIMYCVGDGKSGEWGSSDLAVWCMGPDLAVRWFRTDLEMNRSDAKIALDRHGRLLVWSTPKHSAVMLSSTDGSTIGSLGGREPDDAQVHGFDLRSCTDLFADPDGTLLAYMGEKRLVRYTSDGQGVATWPPRGGLFGPKEEKLYALYNKSGNVRAPEDVPYLDSVGHQPVYLDTRRLQLGYDGRLYAQGSHQTIACFDREGKRVYRVQLAFDSIDSDCFAADAAGHAYVIGSRRVGSEHHHTLVRLSPDGKTTVVAIDRREGGVLGSETHLYVAPDGTAIVTSSDQVRIIGRDGQLLRINAAAKEAETEQDERAARLA